MAQSSASSPGQKHWDGVLPRLSHQGWGDGAVVGWIAVAFGDSGPHEAWTLNPDQTQNPAFSGGCKGCHQPSVQHEEGAGRNYNHPPFRELQPHEGWGGCRARSPDRYGSHGCSGHAGAGTRHWWKAVCMWCRCNCWAHLYLTKRNTQRENKCKLGDSNYKKNINNFINTIYYYKRKHDA